MILLDHPGPDRHPTAANVLAEHPDLAGVLGIADALAGSVAAG